MDHLAENTMIAFVADKLSAAERRDVEQHIDSCTTCRKVLAAMGADSSLLTPYAGTLETETPKGAEDAAHGATLAPGAIVAGRYKIVRALGRGGMGLVFQATDNELHVDVALKLLRPELTRDDEHIRHLRREILTGRAIAHPNACRVFDLGKDERFYFITMEYISGTTLEQRMRDGRLSTASAVEMLATVLSVLAAAHQEGIVHRDLKPANLMLDKNQRLKVMDFGLARDLKGESSMLGAVGTPAYWAPEQARGEPAGPPADVFAVGSIAYLMLSGALSTQAMMRRLDRVPEAYRDWIAKCLDEDPAERFSDGAAAGAAFAQLRSRPVRSRRRRAIPFIAAGALLATTGLWFTFHKTTPVPPPSANAADLPSAPASTLDAGALDAAVVALPVDAAPAAADAAVVDAAVGALPVRPRPARRDAGVDGATRAVPVDAGSKLYE